MIEINGFQVDPQKYVTKWTNWALEATQATDEQIVSNVKALYKKTNLKEPEVKVFRDYDAFMKIDWASVRDSVRASVRDSVGASVGAWYWAEDLGFADVFVDTNVLSKEKAQELEEYKKLLETQRMAVLLLDIAYVLVAPTIRRNDEGQLSNDQRPSVEWENGTGQYYLDGVSLQKELWQRIVSKEMSLSEIMKIEISDQRTVALKYNPQAIIKENAKLIHKDERSNELYLVENSEINKLTEFPKMYFLKMTCPTGRVFIESCDPNVVQSVGENATALQAWACGLTLSEYHSMKMES